MIQSSLLLLSLALDSGTPCRNDAVRPKGFQPWQWTA